VLPRVARHGPYTITVEFEERRSLIHRPRLSTTTGTTVERARLRIERSDSASASEFDAVIKALMDLLTVAANAPAGVISRTLLTPPPEPTGEHEGFRPGHSQVEVLGRQIHVVAADDTAHMQFLFTL